MLCVAGDAAAIKPGDPCRLAAPPTPPGAAMVCGLPAPAGRPCPCTISPSNASRPPLPLRGFRLAGKAYWAMERRVALTAAAIDAGCFRLFLWLDSMPLAAIKACSSRLPPSRGSVQFAKATHAPCATSEIPRAACAMGNRF